MSRKVSRPIDEQVAILMQGVEFGDEQIAEVMAGELRERLAEDRPLRVYCGYDPTAPDIHLGHTVPMNKLRQFQELGHEVTFLIGTFTGLIGDPSDKDSVRKQQTPEEIVERLESYADQAFKILDRERTAGPLQRRLAVQADLFGRDRTGVALYRAAVSGPGPLFQATQQGRSDLAARIHVRLDAGL